MENLENICNTVKNLPMSYWQNFWTAMSGVITGIGVYAAILGSRKSIKVNNAQFLYEERNKQLLDFDLVLQVYDALQIQLSELNKTSLPLESLKTSVYIRSLSEGFYTAIYEGSYRKLRIDTEVDEYIHERYTTNKIKQKLVLNSLIENLKSISRVFNKNDTIHLRNSIIHLAELIGLFEDINGDMEKFLQSPRINETVNDTRNIDLAPDAVTHSKQQYTFRTVSDKNRKYVQSDGLGFFTKESLLYNALTSNDTELNWFTERFQRFDNTLLYFLVEIEQYLKFDLPKLEVNMSLISK